MTKSRKDENLLLLSNNDNHTIMLTDLKRVNIKGMSKQKNNRMLAYFDLLVDDILIYDGDFELDVEISLGADHMFMSIMLEKSYPYYNDCIFLSFDLKEKASVHILAKALSNVDTVDGDDWGSKDDIHRYIDCSLGYEHELFLSDYPPMDIEKGRNMKRNVKLIDEAFFFNNNLMNTFQQNNIATVASVSVAESSFNFSLHCFSQRTPFINVKSPFVEIKIEHDKISIHFNDFDGLKLTTSNNFKRDLNLIQFFLKSFIEKRKDYDLDDLKSELLLFDMETI